MPGAAALWSNVVVGRLVAGSTTSRIYVDFLDNPAGSVEARTTLPLTLTVIEQALATGQGVLLVFENGDPALPIILGLIQLPDVSPLQVLFDTPRQGSVSAEPEAWPKARIAEEHERHSGKREARLDGDRVVLEGKHEVVLKCGEATLTLRRDGKILIRGAYVETHSRGVNRIKGGSVKIN